MNKKEIVKYFYEVIVSENLLNEVSKYVTEERAEEMRRHLMAVRSTYPDYTVSVTRQFEDGEYIVSEIIMRGTHRGEFLGITPTDKVLEIAGINIDRIVNGKITEHGGAANTFETFLENGLIKTI